MANGGENMVNRLVIKEVFRRVAPFSYSAVLPTLLNCNPASPFRSSVQRRPDAQRRNMRMP